MFSNQYFDDREDTIIIFGEKLWYLSKKNMPFYLGNSQKTCSSV